MRNAVQGRILLVEAQQRALHARRIHGARRGRRDALPVLGIMIWAAI